MAPSPHPGYVDGVAESAQRVLEEALKLPTQDRAMVAAGLLASLDVDGADEVDVDEFWSAECERRAQQVESGEVHLVDWEHLVGQIDELRSFPARS